MRSITVASAGIPSTPTIGTATAGNGGATVAFTPSTYTGKGTVIYEVTSRPGGLNGNGTTSPISLSLTNGISYTFTVKAVTNYGVSSESSASSNAVTPSVPLPPPPPAPPPCSCAPQPWPNNCTYIAITCDPDTASQLSYMYYDCGCAQTCPGTAGYNQAKRDGYCGYVAVQTQVCRCSAGSCVDNGCGGQICYDNCGEWCSGTACPAACPDCPGIGPCCPPKGCGGFKDGYICI